MTGIDNGRAERAVLSTKIDNDRARIKDNEDDADLQALIIRDLNDRLVTLSERVARIEERQGIQAKINLAYSTITSLLAGYFGTR